MINILFLFILLNFKIYTNKIIIIPFEEFLLHSRNHKKPEIQFDINKFIEENLSPKFVSNLTIGTPDKIIPAIFNIRETSSYIVPNDEYRLISFNNKELSNSYNPSNSISFRNITIYNKKFYYNHYYLVNETIKLYNDINIKNYEIINNFQIYIRDNLENAFSYIDISDRENNFIINQLKEKKIINSSIISIKYLSDSNGYILIGEYPHIYDTDNYCKEQLIIFNFETSNGKYYDMLTNEINVSWNDINDKNDIKKRKINFQNVISFYHNLNLIIASEEYMNLVKDIFFDEYKKKEICNFNYIPMSGREYLIYTCNKVDELELSNFPTLNFILYESNYVFELNYKDLFLEKNGIYYFLVTTNYHIEENWKIGKPFLKKFQFVFDGTKKLAVYYDTSKIIKKNDKSEINWFSTNKTKIILIFIISNIILIPIFYCLAKRIYIRRKLNAKELNNYYDNINNHKISLNIEKTFSNK